MAARYSLKWEDGMPRRGQLKRRPTQPDFRYNNLVVGQLISKLMEHGKKSVAERIVYRSFDILQEKLNKDPLETFELAIKNASPLLEVKPRRVGGATYQVPVEIEGDRRTSLGMRWLLESAHKRPGRSTAEKLADELIDASRNVGNAIKRREDTHKMAEANRAFAHYRW